MNWRDLSYIFLLLAMLAEILGTIGGFGSSVFFVPIANFYFDFQSVLGLTAIYHLSSNVSKIVLFRKGINKRLLLTIGIPSIGFVILGGYLSAHINSSFLELILGFFLIIFSLLFILKRNLIINPTNKNAITGGALSGLSAGLLGTGGAIRGLTMAAFNLEKSVFIATSAFIDFLIDFTRTIVYYQNGYIHQHDILYLPVLIAIGFIGTIVGRKILTYIPQEKFKIISLVLILIIGLVTLIPKLIV